MGIYAERVLPRIVDVAWPRTKPSGAGSVDSIRWSSDSSADVTSPGPSSIS